MHLYAFIVNLSMGKVTSLMHHGLCLPAGPCTQTDCRAPYRHSLEIWPSWSICEFVSLTLCGQASGVANLKKSLGGDVRGKVCLARCQFCRGFKNTCHLVVARYAQKWCSDMCCCCEEGAHTYVNSALRFSPHTHTSWYWGAKRLATATATALLEQ